MSATLFSPAWRQWRARSARPPGRAMKYPHPKPESPLKASENAKRLLIIATKATSSVADNLAAEALLRKAVDDAKALLNVATETAEVLLARVKLLEGIIPICMYCKKIRDDAAIWQQLESYITKHSEAQFSHGVCPECYEKHKSD